MILDHVAQGAHFVVVASTMLYPHLFGHGNAHIIHIMPVPNWLEERIGKTKCQNVLYRLFAQVMVDAKNLRLVETLRQDPIQFPCGAQIMTNWLFHHNPGALSIPI